MNHSIYSADRSTHLKIVVVALVAAIGVAGAGISARVAANDTYAQASGSALKATKTIIAASSDQQVIR